MAVLTRKNRTLKRILRNKFHAPAHDEPVSRNESSAMNADNEPAYSLSTDIPKSYNDTYVRAIPRDPENTFVYWEVPQEQAASTGIPDKGNIHTFKDKAAWIQEKISAPPPVIPVPLPPPPKQPLPIPETIPSPFEKQDWQQNQQTLTQTHQQSVHADQPSVQTHQQSANIDQPSAQTLQQSANVNQSSVQTHQQSAHVEQPSVQIHQRSVYMDQPSAAQTHPQSVSTDQSSAHTEQTSAKRTPWPIPPTRPSEFESMTPPEHVGNDHYADHDNNNDNNDIKDITVNRDYDNHVDHNYQNEHNSQDDLNGRNNRDIPLHHEICIHPGMSVIPNINLRPGMSLRITTHAPITLDILIRQLSCADPSFSSGIFYNINAGEEA